MPSKPKTDADLHPEKYFTSPVGHPKDRVIINESSDIPREGQFIGLNGYQYLVKPGAEIDLPRPVRKMLDNCVRTETVQVPGEDGRMRTHTRNIQRITYVLVKENIEDLPVVEAEAEKPSARLSA